MAKTSMSTDDAPAREGEVANKWYVVLHNCVGRWWQGQTISDEHLAGHDIQRLVDLGAIGEAGSDAYVMAARDGLAPLTPDNIPTSDPVPLPTPPGVTALPTSPTSSESDPSVTS